MLAASLAIEVSLHWVPAYKSVPSNEAVHILAKESTEWREMGRGNGNR